MRTHQTFALAFAALLAIPLSLGAQQAAAQPAAKPAVAAVTITEATPGLKAKAKISGATALATARQVAPKGSTFSRGELAEEDGRLIYSLAFKVAGKSGVKEITVDALTGSVVEEEGDETGKAHETGSAEC
jgi:uncharacterized membrane protein YkoI